MKKMIKLISLFFIFTLLISNLTMVVHAQLSNENIEEIESIDCCGECIDPPEYEAPWEEFGIYETERVEDFIQNVFENRYVEEVDAYVDDVQVYKDGIQIFEGDVEDGLYVRIEYNSDKFSEYLVVSSSQALETIMANNQQKSQVSDSRREENAAPLRAGNQYGFVLPIDNLIFQSQSAGNVSNWFGPGHPNGMDFAKGGNYPSSIHGVPIRSVKDGVVLMAREDPYNNYKGLGYYVTIAHWDPDSSKRVRTTYGHMNAPSSFVQNQDVDQGDIIGYVGNTGYVRPEPTPSEPQNGTHLHFEVAPGTQGDYYEYGPRLDPMIYLEGATNYNPNTYTVTYDAKNGTDPSSVQVDSGSIINAFPTPNRSNYAFEGWYTSETGGTKVTSPYTVNLNITLYARWSSTVTYDSNGGTIPPASAHIVEGTSISLPLSYKSYTITFDSKGGTEWVPKQVICILEGWNTKKGKKVVGESYFPEGDETVRAQWNNPTVGDLPEPVRSANALEGKYNFEGWYTSDGRKVNDSDTLNSDIILYARWSSTVTYNAAGGTVSPTSAKVIEGSPVTLPTPFKSFTVTFDAMGGSSPLATKVVNWTFGGWSTKKGIAETDYIPTGDETVIAQWTNHNAGALPLPKKFGFTFAGWYTSTTGGTRVTSYAQVTANTTLYARWAAAQEMSLGTTYSTDIDVRGLEAYYKFVPEVSGVYRIFSQGTLDTEAELLNINEYSLCYVDQGGMDNNFSLVYYLVAGRTYYFEIKLSSATATGTFNVTLEEYAADTYTITYNKNDASATGGATSDQKVYGIPMTLTDSVPSRAGFKFVGWAMSGTAETPVYYMLKNGTKEYNLKYTANESVTLYAVWVPLGDVNGDKFINSDDTAAIPDHILGRHLLTGAEMAAADLNNDNLVNMLDYTAVSQIINNYEAVDSISVDTTSLSMLREDTATLTATVLPDSLTDLYIGWKSDNKTVVTVDSKGRLVAVGAGSATITATVCGGSNVTATCVVTVNPKVGDSFTVNNMIFEVTSTNSLVVKLTQVMPQAVSVQGTVTVPGSVTYNGVSYTVSKIGPEFLSGSGAQEVIIPATVTIIDDFAFDSCGTLISINVNADNSQYSSADGILYDKDGHKLYRCPTGRTGTVVVPINVDFIENGAFKGCTLVTGVTLPDGLVMIKSYAFSGAGLTTIRIPGSVIRIEDHAFSNCSQLETAIIENGVDYIGYMAFSNCYNLESIYIPDSIVSIGSYQSGTADYIFSATMNSTVTIFGITDTLADIYAEGCGIEFADLGVVGSTFKENGLLYRIMTVGTIDNPGEVQVAGRDVYENQPQYLYTINIPETTVLGNRVTSIGDYAFNYSNLMQEINISSSVESIGNFAFTYCFNLRYINAASDSPYFTSIDGVLYTKDMTRLEAFPIGRTDLTVYTVPEGVTSISNNAFFGAGYLTSITLPSSLTELGGMAFYQCYNLANIYFNSLQAPLVSPNTFASLPSGAVGHVSPYATGYDSSYTINILINTDEYLSVGDVFVYDGIYYRVTSLVSDGGFANEVAVTRKNSTEGASGQYTVNIPDTVINGFFTVTSIDDEAFVKKDTNNGYINNTSIHYVTIPDTVKVIGEKAFYWLTELRTVTMPANSIVTIEVEAFSGCAKLYNLKLPASLTTIGSSAFEGCAGLVNITIPTAVTSIGSKSFYGCPNLANVYFNRLVAPEASDDSFSAAATAHVSPYSSGYTPEYHGLTVVMDNGTLLEAGTTFTENGLIYQVNSDRYTATVTGRENNFVFPNNPNEGGIVVTIPEYTLAGLRVTSIAAYTFNSFNGMCTINLPKSIESIGDNAFVYCYGLRNINVEAGNLYYSSVDGVLFNSNATILILYPIGRTEPNGYVMPDTVTTIANNAFHSAGNLTEIVLSENLTEIGSSAFYNCTGLTSITIPATVTSIAGSAFLGCNNLTNIYFDGSAPTLGWYSFNSTVTINVYSYYYLTFTGFFWDNYSIVTRF